MLKRFVARLLIITQIYSNLFQGIVHAATSVDESHYHRHLLEKPDDRGDDESIPPTASSSVEDAHISSFTHLYSEINQRGELQFALGDGSFKAPRVFTIPALQSPEDLLEYGGVTVSAQSTSFRFQGLRVSVNRSGVMVVEGCQTAHHNPIFLASNRPIILSNIEASGLSITAPRIVHSGISKFMQLKFEGLGTANGDASFINAGQISAKEFFLTHLNSVNGGGISATRFAVDGQLASTGVIASSELILEENALLKLTETSRADIKTLFLSKSSHLENHVTTHTTSIGVLDGLGGSLTNHGILAVGEVAADSAFQAITNRHFLDIALGTIQTQQFENHGTFISSQSDLQVADGQNLGAIKAKGLLVKAEFTNTATGSMDTSLVSGSGHLCNLGKIETEETLELAIKRFSNSGLVKAQSVIGWIPDMSSGASLSGIEQLDNGEDGVIEASVGISFTEATQVNNFGKIQTEDMALYSDKTLQKGDLIARTLNLIGRTFLNQGEITVDHLTAENGLINQANLVTSESTDFGAGSLTNAAKAKAQLKGLGLSGDTKIINHGKLAIDGVDTTLGILQITNTGKAIIDAGHVLPRSSAVIYAKGLAIDPEFDDFTMSMMQRIATHYKSLVKPTDGKIDSEFAEFTMPMMRRAATTYKQQAIASFRLRTLQDLEEQVRAATRQELSEQTLLEKTDQLRVVERYQVLDAHFKPERDLIEMGMGGVVASLMRPGLILEPIRAEHLRKREELKQLTAEKRALEQELAANSRLVEQRQKVQAQITAYQKLAPEIFNVRLSVVNQATGNLSLKSGHFDLTGDQALLNDGMLSQEAAQLQWTDPTTWSQPRNFNAGTWQVKGALALMGNADKDVGKLLVEDGLHVYGSEIASRVLRGQIETADFSAGSSIEMFGTLVINRSTQLQGLTIAADAVADLKGLKLTGGEISNLGKLRVIGVDPASGVIKLTNGGSAMIDDQRILPKLDEHSPENLARVATRNGPVTWDSDYYDHEFSGYSPSTWKSRGSEYLRLFKALSTKQPYVREYKTEPEFDGYSPSAHKTKATRYKRDFIKRYESEVVKSQTEGSPAEQAELQEYLKQFAPHYQQVLAKREAYAKSSHPAVGAALVLENAQIPAIKLQLLNQASGQLTLKSGKFEFVGDAALVNDGSLTQHSAYTLWLTSMPGAFSRGSWRSAGSLGLLGYIDARFAELQVGGTLYVDSTNDAFKVLEGLAKAQAARVSIKASVANGLNPELAELYPMLSQKAYETELFKKDMLPKLYAKIGGDCRSSYEKYIQSFAKAYPYNIAIRDAFAQAGDTLETWIRRASAEHGLSFAKLYGETERRVRLTELAERFKVNCPWPLELLISGNDFTNAFNLSAPSLKILSRIFRTSGNIYAHSGVFDLSAEYGTEANHAFMGGRDGITLRSKTLGILANKVATGAAVPNILYKRPELGLYSEAGPVVINVAELITCHYGDIKGTSFTITAPQLINTAGLICATEPGLKSVLNIKSIKHVRDEQGSRTSYGCCGHPSMSISAKNRYNHNQLGWCGGNGCRPNVLTYETSGEAILFARGDLDLTYETLEMLVSSITSLGTLKLVSKGVSLDVPNLAVGAELPALPGTTTMTKRNGHVNRLVAKKGLLADVGTADMAADMRGENIHVKAALITLRSLGIAPQQQAQFIDLFTQESSSSALQMVGDRGGRSGRYVDTVLPLRHKAIPDSLVVLGPDATQQMHSGAMLDVQMSMRAMEEIMGNQIYTLIRGVSGLGLSVPDFFKATSSFVRGHKDTVSQRRLIKAGEDQQEVEVQFNATLTPKDLVASGLPAVFMRFGEAINTLEAEQDALAAVISKPRVMMGIPAADAERGIIAEKTVVLESATDLSVATSVKAKEQVAIVAQGTTTVASDVIHHQSGENYTQTLDRTTVAADKVLIQGHDVHLKAIDTHSTQRTDIIATGGSVVDEAVPLVSYRVDRYHSKDESTTVRTTHVHQTTSSHRSDGIAAIVAPVGILQQGTHLANATLEAPVVIQDAVHDQHIVDIETIRHKKAGGIFGSWFGITERKTTHSSSAASIARGGINAGREFIANATTRFRAVAPTFTADRSDITAPQIELTTGISHHQSFTQSTYQGPIWNKSSVSTEKHTTHCNPTFEHNIYLHSPSVILERVRGSAGTFDRIISDTPIQFRDVDDQHHSTHQSQKSLSAGATLILSLAVTLATMNPTAAMSTMSIEGAMLSAAYGTLCSQTAICLVEKDGNLGKAIDELGRRDIGKTMLISAASAGLTKGLGDKLKITKSTAFDNLARKHLLQSAINTTLSVAIDGQRPEDAIKQGLTSAAINTLAAYAAGKIGGAYFDKDIDPFSHKLLHGVLGAASGATSAMILNGDVGRGAMSGAFGAVLAETITDAFSPDQADIDSYVAEHPGVEKEAVKTHFMEKTQATANWSVFTSTLGAFSVGLDASVTHSTARNAVDHNMLLHVIAWLAISTAVSIEWYHFTNDIKAEGIETALGKLGIRVIEDATIAMAVSSGIAAAPIAFEVGGVVCKTLREAIALVRAHPLITKEVTETCQALEHNMPKLQKMLDGLKVGADKTRGYVRDQFNYREHFAAERRFEAEKASVEEIDSIWHKGPVVRGEQIEKQLGQNLHQNFPVVDKFENGRHLTKER